MSISSTLLPKQLFRSQVLSSLCGQIGIPPGVKSPFFFNKPASPWKIEEVPYEKNQFCRGMTVAQLKHLLEINQLTQKGCPKEFGGLQKSNIASQALRGGDPNLLSMSKMENGSFIANHYGANRHIYPGLGALIVTSPPAVFTDLPKQAKACEAMCIEEQQYSLREQLFDTEKLQPSPDIINLTQNCAEQSAVIGHHEGVDFSGLFDIDNHVHKIYFLLGTGRSASGLFATKSYLLHEFTNENYASRAFSLEIALTTNKVYLEKLHDSYRNEGIIKSDERILTSDDAAIILADPELRAYIAMPTPQSSEGLILDTLPNDLDKADLPEYIKWRLKEVGLFKSDQLAS